MGKNLIYCFSGTGNSLFIAENIAKCLHNTDIVSIKSLPAVLSSDGYDTVGFIYPCHGGGLPAGMAESLKKIRVSLSCYTYAVCSYAGYIGCGNREINSIISLNYWRGISHHCSCNWLFPHELMLPPFISIEKANKRALKLSNRIAEDIINRVTYKDDVPKKLLNKAEHSAWPYIARLKSKGFMVSDKCVHCGLCQKICPMGNIKTDDAGNVTAGSNCIQCMSCVQYCPNGAIQFGNTSFERYHNPEVPADKLVQSFIHID